MRLFLALSIPFMTVVSVESFSSVPKMPNPVRMEYSLMARQLSSQPTDPDTPDTPASSKSEAPSPIDEIKVKITKVMDKKNFDSILGNALSGEFGKRGEAYVAAQAFLVLCILFGGLPILGDLLNLLCGPLLMIAGLGVAALGVIDLGGALSPWPVPTGDDLITDGIYSKMRHPIYAGLLAIMAGFSVATGSAPRLLLTAALWYLLDIKSDYEEKQLVEEYTDYEAYQESVPGKFFPQEIIAILPWTDSDDSGGSFQ